MSHYLILIHTPATGAAPDAGQHADPHAHPDRAENDRHADALATAGTMVAAYALQPSAQARSVRADGVTDGPFLETKEVVAGVYVIEAPDLDTAVAIAGQNPVVRQGGGVEVREIESSTLDG